jgi:hypothetical protein
MRGITFRNQIAAALAVACCAAAVVAAPAQASSKHFRTVFGANPHWANTGISFLNPLITGTAVASGLVNISSSAPANERNADGIINVPCGVYASPGHQCPDNAAPLGSLIGRYGPTGKPFFVGTASYLTGIGDLELIVNDVAGLYGDNLGAFTVQITQYFAGH